MLLLFAMLLLLLLVALLSEARVVKLSVLEAEGLQKSFVTNKPPIASGSLGNVYLGEYQYSKVAIKFVPITNKEQDEGKINDFRTEAERYSMLTSDENIVAFKGAVMAAKFLMLVTEYQEGGDLFDALHSKLMFRDNASRIEVALDVGRGVRYLHNLKFIHGSLNSKNVLLTKVNRGKLCDFGLAPTQADAPHIAPELRGKSGVSEEGDIYRWVRGGGGEVRGREEMREEGGAKMMRERARVCVCV